MNIRLYAATLALLCSLPASALSVSFVQPNGTVTPSETIEVWLRIAADSDFNFDGTDIAGGFGIDPALIPTSGFVLGNFGVTIDFDEFTSANTATSFTCSGSFTDGGGGPCPPGDEYDFFFNGPGPDSFSFQDMYSLAAGETQDVLFGTFTPLDGSAAPGEYNFYSANLTIQFYGLGTDENGDTVSIFRSVRLASTCATGDDSCAFSRVVVPVPGAVWLFGSALLAVFGARRRLDR